MLEKKVGFPLQGIWEVVTSPADHVPSHYTEILGMSYAFDFAKSNDIKLPIFSRMFGVTTESCKGWGENVLSPYSGKVVEVSQIAADRTRLNFFVDFHSGLQTLFFNHKRTDYNSVFGNYIIIEKDSYFCLLAHLQEGSIQVGNGDQVEAGDTIAKVGHCGSSQLPHLHFQLMDSPDLSSAKGIPVCFDLEVLLENDRWESLQSCIPSKNTKVRIGNTSNKAS